jgi:argininosuccinate lyase
MAKNKNNQAIWNTRIKKKASSLFQKVGNSIDIDKRLYKEDIQGFYCSCRDVVQTKNNIF